MSNEDSVTSPNESSFAFLEDDNRDRIRIQLDTFLLGLRSFR
jgi:hypothetical protein